MGSKITSIFLILVSLWGNHALADYCKDTLKYVVTDKKHTFATYWEQLADLPKGNPVPVPLLKNIIRSATEELDKHGYKWILNPTREYSIIILPAEKIERKVLRHMPLDEFAAFARNSLTRVQVEFNPKELAEEHVGALFIDADNRLVLSNEEIEKGYLTDQGLHEGAGHGLFAKFLAEGKDNHLFGNLVSKNEKIKFDETYKHEFALDELYSYSIQISDIIKDLIELKAKDNPDKQAIKLISKDLGDIIRTQIRLSKHTQKSSTQSFLSADLLVKENQKWPVRKEMINGKEVDVYYNGNTKIYFQLATEGPANHKEFQREVMHAFINNGDVELDIILIDEKIIKKQYPNNEAMIADVVQKLRTKVAGLAKISAPLVNQYKEILEDLKNNNLSEALERSERISQNLLL